MMVLVSEKPFEPKKLEEDRGRERVISVWLSPEDQRMLKFAQGIIEQERESTAIKQLMRLGIGLVGEPKTAGILDIVFKNKRNNARQGIAEFDTNLVGKNGGS